MQMDRTDWDDVSLTQVSLCMRCTVGSVKKKSEQRIKRSDELSNQRSDETTSRERNNRANIDERGWLSFVLARDNATFLFTGLVSLVISVLVQCPVRVTSIRPKIHRFFAGPTDETKFDFFLLLLSFFPFFFVLAFLSFRFFSFFFLFNTRSRFELFHVTRRWLWLDKMISLTNHRLNVTLSRSRYFRFGDCSFGELDLYTRVPV